MHRVSLLVLACVVSCGVRAPAPIDVDALLRARGPVEARRDLVIRVTGDPRDVAGHLALAALADRTGRPSEAIEQLEAVVALGGPAGVRWAADDRARLARLIAARGRARLARGSASALADLQRARELGAATTIDEVRAARAAGAIVALRHSDADVRDRGRRMLADQAGTEAGASAEAKVGTSAGSGAGTRAGSRAWLGARSGAPVEQRGHFGAWLWAQGARRAARDELAAWHAAAAPPRDRAIEEAYLAAARWWTPFDRPAPPLDGDAGSAMRCAFGACTPREVAGDEARERAYLQAPVAAPVRDPDDAAALAVITLHQALRGEVAWGAALAARIDGAAFADPAQLARVPGFARPVVAWLAGREARPPGDGATPDQRLVIAAARVLAGGGAEDVAGLVDGGPYAAALRAIVAPRVPFTGDARAEAAARHASLVVPGAASVEPLRAIATAFHRDPAIADRLAGEVVAGAVDAAAMHATLGALFDAIGDPARARVAWQAAVDASAEAAFLRGLAEAEARQGDGDAALVAATSAAAWSGDPAVVWAAVARGLAGAGRYVHALDAARSAIELAGPETLAAALDVAIAASRALGRDAQARGLAAERARVAPAGGLGARDPTDAAAALEDHRRHPGAATIAELWVASRWNPRDVELRAALIAAVPASDPRHGVIAGELVDLAGGGDREIGRAAAAALR